MATKDDRERVERKRKAVAGKIREIAPHADSLVALLDEARLDMLVLGLRVGEAVISDGD